jgi:NADPH:quinone reductase-like Zn-dependent oxidoreductase
MKRSVILQSYGTVDNLQYSTSKSIPNENLSPTQIMIQIKACAISHLDIQVRKGMYQFLTSSSSTMESNNDEEMILGYEIAGVIKTVGSEVNRFKLGDHVAGMLPLDHTAYYKHL